jgi:hypothetical protein
VIKKSRGDTGSGEKRSASATVSNSRISEAEPEGPTPSGSRISDGPTPSGSRISDGPTPSSSRMSTAMPGTSHMLSPSGRAMGLAIEHIEGTKSPKIARKFQEAWKVGKPWLHFDSKSHKMICLLCVQHKDAFFEYNISPKGKCSNFVTGCENFKKSTAGQTLIKLKSHERDRLRVLFRNAHAVAKKNRPLTDCIWMAELDEAKGLLPKNSTYRNSKACKEFVDVIAEKTVAETVDLVKNCSFFSLCMDGSTDLSSVEQESLFVRTTSAGVVNQRLVKIGEPNSTRASDLYQFIQDSLEEVGMAPYMDKFVSFSCDGASNMIGKNSGAATLLQKDNPACVITHCLAHRLELAYKDAIKAAAKKTYEKLTTLLVGLYYFYKRSSKQKKALRETFLAHQLKGRIPSRVGGTRWMGHMKIAIEACLKSYPALCDQLSTASHDNSKAEGLFKILTDFETVTFMLLIKSLLENLNRLSVWLQGSNATISDVFCLSQTTLDLVLGMQTKNSLELQEVLDSRSLKGQTMRGSHPKMAYKAKFLDAVSNCISSRFNDLEKPLIRSTRIGSLRQWPQSPSEDFGQEEVEILFRQYRNAFEVDLNGILQEWQVFKSLLYRSFGATLQMQKMGDMHASMFDMEVPNILRLMDLTLAMCPTSVLNERSFSQMKLVKTERRQRISAKLLNSLMFIRTDGSEIKNFNPDSAIDSWRVTPTGHKRRLNYKRQASLGQANEADLEI